VIRPRHVAVAVLGLAIAPLTAGAVIEPNRGIAGVSLDMSQPQVRTVLGKPLRVEEGTGEFGPFVTFRYRGLTVSFLGARRVTGISTTRAGERTRGGIGVGTTEARLRRRIPALRCATFGGVRTCTLGRGNAGERMTDFFITRGRVSRVVVAILID
jgi:hypothetical protein